MRLVVVCLLRCSFLSFCCLFLVNRSNSKCLCCVCIFHFCFQSLQESRRELRNWGARDGFKEIVTAVNTLIVGAAVILRNFASGRLAVQSFSDDSGAYADYL
jgi:hypothetical protein